MATEQVGVKLKGHLDMVHIKPKRLWSNMYFLLFAIYLIPVSCIGHLEDEI